MLELSAIKKQMDCSRARGQAVVFVTTIDAMQGFSPLLTEQEAAKFNRVRLADQRRTHALGRGLVRYFLDLPSVDFSIGSSGKLGIPYSTEFNISHSGKMIAVAFHNQSRVGVDIEVCSRQVLDTVLAERVCHPDEIWWIAQHSPDKRAEAFLKCWVRKEAVLKANGIGLVDELQEIDTYPNLPNPVLPTQPDLQIWDIPKDICPNPGALATDPNIKCVAFFSTEAKAPIVIDQRRQG